MKRFYWRILICLVPTLVSIGVVARAYNEYQNGRGGFVLGIDLAGGTTLVYEVDESKMTPEARASFKVEDLANALKRRIDPADLYNVTIRPIGGTPERVEIVLPTGGKHQADIEREKWDALLAEAGRRFPAKDGENPYADVRLREGATLIDRIAAVKRPEVESWVKEQTAGKTSWEDVLKAAATRYPPEGREGGYKDIPAGRTAELVIRIMEVERRSATAWYEGKTLQTGKGKRMLTGDEVENIKNLIAKQGRLEFRILANSEDDEAALAAARDYFKPLDPAEKGDESTALARRQELSRLEQRAEPPPPPRRDGNLFFPVKITNEPDHTYSWVEIGKMELYTLGLNSEALQSPGSRYRAEVEKAEKTGQPFRIDTGRGHISLVYVRPILDWSRREPKDRQLGKTREFFLLVRDPIKGKEITGDYLIKASQGFGQRGERTIDFVFNSEGGELFYDVTSRNKPSGSGDAGFKRHLAVVFDAQIITAPSLNSAIRTNGQITGNFTQAEIDEKLRLLRAGALPATLKKEPVSESSTGATLGAETIKWGTISVAGAFVAVMAFMVFYYRFAGLVACVALLANLLLTVAFMVIVQAAFTLPGLAGLVLMLGMAVDANVLIYERLREERDRGANLMMALRNGYDRAFPTILDTHLSSIFTAIVLYVVGNDQLKGFGISLTVGLFISLFTSLFMTRTIFEICLYKGWVKELKFFEGLVKLIHSRYWDFMSIRHYWFAATIILTLLGAALFIYRADSDPRSGKATVLNIDFTGGTAYTGQLNTPMDLDALRAALEPKSGEAALPDLSIQQNFVSGETTEGGKSPYFTVRTSEKDSERVLGFISEHLKGDLKILLLESFALETGKGGATGARLKFTNEKKEPDFASPAQVQRVLSREFLDRGLSPSSFSVERPDKRELSWEDVLTQAAQTYPVAGQARPYADIKKDDRAALAESIFTKSVRPRVESWVKENAGPKAEWKAVLEEAAKSFASPGADGYSKGGKGDTKALASAIESAERRNVAAWAKLMPVGEVEKDGRFALLQIKMSEPTPPADLESILASAQKKFEASPQPERLEVFDKQLASNTQERALYAVLASWGAILLYLWFRFGNWTFGAAAVLCLVHDLVFTLGIIAACHYIHALFGSYFLGIQDFKIDLHAVAALLTLVGYSVNDTIVVFDRIREVRGKNPHLTPQMINDSVNQTLTRTILASATVMVVVLVLYAIGGEGVKLFAFVMIVGVVVGTYSSIYIASPLLLIFGEGRPASPVALDRAPVTADRG